MAETWMGHGKNNIVFAMRDWIMVSNLPRNLSESLLRKHLRMTPLTPRLLIEDAAEKFVPPVKTCTTRLFQRTGTANASHADPFLQVDGGHVKKKSSRQSLDAC
jgi:phenylalanyl-tRNA synthetase alpha subunit